MGSWFAAWGLRPSFACWRGALASSASPARSHRGDREELREEEPGAAVPTCGPLAPHPRALQRASAPCPLPALPCSAAVSEAGERLGSQRHWVRRLSGFSPGTQFFPWCPWCPWRVLKSEGPQWFHSAVLSACRGHSASLEAGCGEPRGPSASGKWLWYKSERCGQTAGL